MLIDEGFSPGAGALAEAKAYLRIDSEGEDALIGRLIGAAVAVCETFVGRMLVARGVAETVGSTGGWRRLRRTPVVSVTEVLEVRDGVTLGPVPASDHAVDIDGDGDGWVRSGGTYFTGGQALRVAYRAGMAAEWADVPVALRHGVMRLVAHLYADRDADGAPPAAVAALWRPYRRMPFGRARDARADRAREVLR